MKEIDQRINELLSFQDSETEVEKVNSDIVRKAVSLMKKKKLDVSQGFSSDCLLNAPSSLFDHLATVFRSWLYHGRVTKTILACAFIPLLKSSLKDPAASENYRSIVRSSLILQVFEWFN